jgi:hypothetical protein
MLSPEILCLRLGCGNKLMDEQPVSIEVDATAKFQKKIKSLEKKYRNIKDDVRPLLNH